MIVKGTIDSIVFRNNENSYTILNLKTSNGMMTICGRFPVVGEGEEIEANGDYKINPKYGRQFEAESVRVYSPKDLEQIEKYLSCGLILGVGPVTAKAIVKKFGLKSLDMIEGHPEAVSKIKGISLKKAIQISQTVIDIKKMQEAVLYLQRFDISINLAVKIYEQYKSKTEIILSKNPYKMIEDIDGVGFKTADKIAEKMGIDRDSEFRMRAGIIHCLQEISDKEGSTYCVQKVLQEKTCKLLEMDSSQKSEAFEKVLVSLIIDGLIQEHDDERDTLISLSPIVNQEKSIASNISRLVMSTSPLTIDIDADILEFERVNNISLHEKQIEAIKTAVLNGFSIITGGPGTGKTTILNAIIKIFKSRGMKCTLVAPTGRAAKRLSESTGEEAGTIHRTLESSFVGRGRVFSFNEKNKLETDVVVCDETSMLDCFLAASLLKAIPNGARLVFVGDSDQLPSVGAGNVLHDIIESKIIPVVKLSRIYRQSDNSKICDNAHLVNEGKMPDISNKSSDFFFISEKDPEQIAVKINDLIDKRLPDFLKCDWKSIQVICPTKAGYAGTENLNNTLQKTLNNCAMKQIISSGKTFKVGDRVMQTANNYDQQWAKDENGILVSGNGVFNGDIGYIEDVNEKTSEVLVEFEDGRYSTYSIAELPDLALAYAITIHKSQGSEFDCVVIPIQSGNPFLFNRNLLYTAVTRAKKLVVLVGTKENISYMVWNTKTIKRNTMLQRFLKEKNELFD